MTMRMNAAAVCALVSWCGACAVLATRLCAWTQPCPVRAGWAVAAAGLVAAAFGGLSGAYWIDALAVITGGAVLLVHCWRIHTQRLWPLAPAWLLLHWPTQQPVLMALGAVALWVAETLFQRSDAAAGPRVLAAVLFGGAWFGAALITAAGP